MDEFRLRIIAQQDKKLDQRSSGYTRNRAPIQRITNRPKTGTLRVKWLNELEQEEDLGIPTRFEEKYTKGCYNAAIIRYFLIDKLYTPNQLYGKQYRQRHNNKQEDFYMQLDEKVV